MGDDHSGGDGGGSDEAAAAIVVRPATPGDADAIQALFDATFGVRTMDAWRWRYVEVPTPALVLVIELGGEMVGHAAWNCFDAYLDGERRMVTSGGDWMYRPDVRGTGLSKHLLPAMFELYATAGASVEFPSPEAFVAIERRSYAVEMLGAVPQWVRWRTGRAVQASNARVPRPLGWAASRVMAVRARLGRRGAPGRVVVARAWAEREELDALATSRRDAARCMRVRDGAYVRWRWQEQPDRAWWMLTARDSTGALDGWLVAGVDPDGIGRIVDLLVGDAATLTALATAAVDALGDAGAEVVTCELLDPRPWVGAAMRRAGYADRGAGPVAVCTWVAEGHPAWGKRESWYLTRGDTDFA